MDLNRDAIRLLPVELQIEIEENVRRQPLTQTELAIAQRAILEVLQKQAKPGTRTDLGTSEKPFSEVRAMSIVGKLFNESHKQVEKRQAVVAAAQAEPEKFGKLQEDMDRTGRVHGPYKRLKVMTQAAAIRAEPPPYPNRGPYRVIVADPPWPYEVRQEDPSHRGVLPYTSMSIEQICAIDLPSIAHDDCVLWLWTTNAHMFHAGTVLDAWGFENKTILTWFKDKMGMGNWLRGQTEHCVMAVRGCPTVQITNQTTAQFAPVREHSRKPDEFYSLVESLCPAPRYAYLFSRTERERWDCHGDEVGMFGAATNMALPKPGADAGLPDPPPPTT
jgi:N6-adenosine-specific RNA methylase IME4